MTKQTNTFTGSASALFSSVRRIAPALAAAVFLAVTGWSTQSQAAGNYGAFCLKNRTGIPINFFVKIGPNGSWKSRTIRPGTSHLFWHRYEYRGENHSPQTWIRFDADLKYGYRYMRTFRVNRNAVRSRSCRGARHYKFVRTNYRGRYVTMVRN